MRAKNIAVISGEHLRKGKTDWASLPTLARDGVRSARGDGIAAAVASAADAASLDIDWSEAVLAVPAKKKAISIRIDPGVLDYFKNEGPGYQRRINAVLRSYVEQKQKRGTSA